MEMVATGAEHGSDPAFLLVDVTLLLSTMGLASLN
jgi:hypothetical protein